MKIFSVSCFLLPGCAAQMVETNWGGGQSLYVFLKSCVSLEVEGEVAVAQASSRLMWAMAASLCLPDGHDTKQNGCSSCLTYFSQDKFLHPSTWLNQQKSVCAWRSPVVSPAAAPADAEAAFGVHISLAVPGLFYIGCLSWACILPVLLQIELWQTASFHLFRVSELWRAGWPQRYANNFLVLALVLRDAAMFPSAPLQLVLSSVCAKTCTVAGWDLVWELGVCCHSHPFLPRKQEKLTAGLVSHLHLSITFTPVLSPSLCFRLYTVYSSKWRREMLIRAFVKPHHVICVVFLSLYPQAA